LLELRDKVGAEEFGRLVGLAAESEFSVLHIYEREKLLQAWAELQKGERVHSLAAGGGPLKQKREG